MTIENVIKNRTCTITQIRSDLNRLNSEGHV